MRMRRCLALSLVGTLAGCYVEPQPDDSFDPNLPEDPSEPEEPDNPTVQPDFLVDSVTASSALSTVQGLVRAQLCNRGTGPGRADVSFFLSHDTMLDAWDTLLTTSARINVTADGCRDVTAQVLGLEIPDGNYFLLALADPYNFTLELDESNNRRAGSSVLVDFTPPAMPSMAWVVDSSSQQLPRLVVQSEAGATLRVYQGGSCVGPSVADSSVGPSASCELPVNLLKYPASTYSARAYDAAGNDSACASLPAPEGYGDSGETDTTPPPPPVITEATWTYGTSQQSLHVNGTAEPGSEVEVFIDAECTDSPAATVTASSTGAFTAELLVATAGGASIRRVFVAARDAALNTSECVEGPPYETPCAQGLANCDGNPANGCEVNLTEDANHCGTCATSCQAPDDMMGVCVAGTCGTACAVGRYDCDRNPDNGCESTTACAPDTCTISRSAELAITALSVVEDPVRTAPGGAWSFGTLMRAMAGEQDPSTLVRQWLKTWTVPQTVNGLVVPARPQVMSRLLEPWEQRSGGPNQPLDFSRAPLRLLAIMNRMDLRNPGVQAGEGRFVFGVLDPSGNPLPFTVILEYALPGGSPEAIQRWAKDWHELGQLGLEHPDYNAKLQALTDRFAKSGVRAGRPFGNSLNQVRTNEVVLADPWEMREFNLTDTGLRPATVKLTPDLKFQNSDTLGDYIRDNQEAILAEQYVVPEQFGGVSFLGGAAEVPVGFYWRAPGVTTEARHKFSLHTCSGCHAAETATDFMHISPRAAGHVSVLSVFLRGGTVKDPWTQVPRTFDDLGRRAADLSALVCGTGSTQGLTRGETFGGFPAPSNLPRARVH